MFRKVARDIMARVKAAKPPGQEPAATNTPELIEPPPAPTAADVLSERLAGIADDNDRLLDPALHYVALDDVRDALGEVWAALSLQVTTLAAHQLQRWLKPADSFSRHGDAGFLIKFDGLDREAGERQAARAALRMKAALVQQFPQLADGTCHPSASGAFSLARIHETDTEQLAKVADRVNRAQNHTEGMKPGLWRTAVGQATFELLEAGAVVSIDSLLRQLEATQDARGPILRSVSTSAAITRLRENGSGSGKPEADSEAGPAR